MPAKTVEEARRAQMQRNKLAEEELAREEADKNKKPEEPSTVSKPGFLPLPFHRYRPSEVSKVTDRRVHFWFYVYIYSSEVDRLMAPFLQLDKRFPQDRRLLAIMNKSGVRISLGGLELYKSLPRRVVILQAACWDHIVRAIFEMEDLLPDFMRYASYPILMDNSTLLFNCTSFRQTAGIVRITKPLT